MSQLKLWALRETNNSLLLYADKPRPNESHRGYTQQPGACLGHIQQNWFPDLKPGEYREVTLTLEVQDG